MTTENQDTQSKPATQALADPSCSRFVLEAKMGSQPEEAEEMLDWIEHNRSSRFLQQIVAKVQERYFFENNEDRRASQTND